MKIVAVRKEAVEVVLTLDEDTAVWLRCVMQNPIHDAEDIDSQRKREELFTQLQGVTK